MSDLYTTAEQFIHQQIEIYGDEPACAVMPHHFAAEETPAKESDWHNSSTLAELEDRIKRCEKCILHRTRNKFVFGTGPENADLLLIGEAPGADEDRIGEPFVGKAGDLLAKMLGAVDIEKSSVYIANILKCRPPQNRDPLPEEIALCKPYVLKQIELINPLLIVCLGRFAAHTLLNSVETLSKLRGQTFVHNNSKVIAMYHPAALLHNPGLKREAWEDLKRMKRLLEELKSRKQEINGKE